MTSDKIEKYYYSADRRRQTVYNAVIKDTIYYTVIQKIFVFAEHTSFYRSAFQLAYICKENNEKTFIGATLLIKDSSIAVPGDF